MVTGTAIHLGPLVDVIHPGHGEAGDIIRTYLVLEGEEPTATAQLWEELWAQHGPAIQAAQLAVVEAQAATEAAMGGPL